MKKIFIIAMLAMTASIAKAQLKVDSLGKVKISYYSGALPLQDTEAGYEASIRNHNEGGLLVWSQGAAQNPNYLQQYGINSNIFSPNSEITAINGTAIGFPLVNVTNNVFGLRGIASNGTNTIGVYGHATMGLNGSFAAAVYGTTGTQSITSTGTYAGFFDGDVKVTGTIATSNFFTLLPNSAPIRNSNNETGSGLPITDRLNNIQFLQYSVTNETDSKEENTLKISTEDILSINGFENNDEFFNEKPVRNKPASVNYGLEPEQLQKEFPELVYEDGQGNYSVNYVEMVPLLVQSIKELSAKVTILEEQLGIQETTKPVMKTKGKTEDADNVTLTFPNNAHEATLNIYDLSGKLLRTSPVNMAETRNLSNYTRGLPTGTYAYTLTVNGQKQKARKVVVKN